MQVRLYATLRASTGGGRIDLSETCDTVGEALDVLIERFPELAPLILTAPRQLRPMIAVMVNGRDIRHLDGLATPLTEASALDIFPPVAGGAEVTRTVAVRGIPEWLLRDYLIELGAQVEEAASPAPRLCADGWQASWTQRLARIDGSVMTITEFTVSISGEETTTADVERAFLAKAQRGGG